MSRNLCKALLCFYNLHSSFLLLFVEERDNKPDEYLASKSSSLSRREKNSSLEITVIRESNENRDARDVAPNSKMFDSSKREVRARRKVRNPDLWKRNVRKRARQEGREYVSTSGKIVPAKRLRPSCACRRRCSSFLPEDARTSIFSDFYKLPSELQNQFISGHVQEIEKKVQRVRTKGTRSSRRSFSRRYFLLRREVCQTMFVNTLGITVMKVRVIVEKRRHAGGGVCPVDARGRHDRQLRLTDERRRSIVEHIDSLSAGRADDRFSRHEKGRKEYFPDGNLSVARMYRLYVEYCEERRLRVENESAYRRVFLESVDSPRAAPGATSLRVRFLK